MKKAAIFSSLFYLIALRAVVVIRLLGILSYKGFTYYYLITLTLT